MVLHGRYNEPFAFHNNIWLQPPSHSDPMSTQFFFSLGQLTRSLYVQVSDRGQDEMDGGHMVSLMWKEEAGRSVETVFLFFLQQMLNDDM